MRKDPTGSHEMGKASNGSGEFCVPPLSGMPRKKLVGKAAGRKRRDNPLGDAEYEQLDNGIKLVTNFDDIFKRGKVLGEGSFGITQLVTHKATGEQYALKVLKDVDEEMLEEEAAVLRLLSRWPKCKPHIVCFYDAFAIPLEPHSDDIAYAILTDFVAGRGLDKVIEQDKLSLCKKFAILLGALEGTQIVHAAGFAHRDIKPANMIYTPDGEIKLIDFGLSCARARSSDVRCKVDNSGTRIYMAPEVALEAVSPSDPGKAYQLADIFAIGVIAFELFMHKLPYTNPKAVPRGAVPNLKQEEVEGVSDCLQAVIQSMIAVDPNDRPSAVEAIKALKRCKDCPRS